jgi:hypothetical protein
VPAAQRDQLMRLNYGTLSKGSCTELHCVKEVSVINLLSPVQAIGFESTNVLSFNIMMRKSLSSEN